MAWMLQGKKNPDFLGAKGCKTDLKSEIKVIGVDGKAEPMTSKPCDTVSCVPTWTDLERPKEIVWKAQTISDGSGASDKIEIDLQYFDLAYVTQVTEAAMNTMTDDEIDLALTDPDRFTAILLPLVQEKHCNCLASILLPCLSKGRWNLSLLRILRRPSAVRLPLPILCPDPS